MNIEEEDIFKKGLLKKKREKIDFEKDIGRKRQGIARELWNGNAI